MSSWVTGRPKATCRLNYPPPCKQSQLRGATCHTTRPNLCIHTDMLCNNDCADSCRRNPARSISHADLTEMMFTLLKAKRIPNFSQREAGIRHWAQAHCVQAVNHVSLMICAADHYAV